MAIETGFLSDTARGAVYVRAVTESIEAAFHPSSSATQSGYTADLP